jgi:tetratricopeptide (TPR) repeat protein
VSGLLRRGWWLLAPAAVLFAYRGIGRNGFLGDAKFLIAENRYLRDLSLLWENLRHDYFWSSSGATIPYWRPVTKLSWLLEYQLFGGSASGYAWVQLGWQLIGVLGVQLLARNLGLDRRWAVVAGLLFGLSAVAIEPVSLLMARSDVVCASATLWAIASWHRWSQGGARGWAGLHLLWVLLALGSKETGVMIAPAITLWALLRGWLADPRGKRDALPGALLRTLPAWAASAAALAVRARILGSRAGSDVFATAATDPLRIFASLARYLQNLLPFRLNSTVRNLPQAEAASLGFLLPAALTLAAAGLLLVWLVRRRRADALGLAGWLLLSLAPVLAVGEISVPGIAGKYPLADRWLQHALAAASLLAALAFARLPAPVQPAVLLVSAAWAAAVISVNEPVRAEYVSTLSMLRTEDRAVYFATPPEFRTAEDECRFLDRQQLRAAEAGELATALELSEQALAQCRDDLPTRNLYRLSALVGLGRFDEARPLAEALLAKPPTDPRGHAHLAHLAGITFLETGSPEEAERWLLTSRELGNRSCGIEQLLARASLASLRPALASQQLEAAYDCGGRTDPGLLLSAASWSLYAGEPVRVRKLLARIQSEQPASAALASSIAQLEAQMARMGRPD